MSIKSISVALVLLTAIGLAVADDGWWNVDHGGYWSTPGNWLNGIVADGVDGTAYFTYDVTSGVEIELGSNRTIGHLEFADTGGGESYWYFDRNTSSKTLTLSTTSGTPTITATDAVVILNSGLAGNQGFTYSNSGSAQLTLSGRGNYTNLTGDIVVGGWGLYINPGVALNADANFVVNSGMQLVFLGTTTIGGLSGTGQVYLSSSGSNIQLTVGAGNQTTTFGGQIKCHYNGESLAKIGSGTLTLTSTSSDHWWTGGTTLGGGTLSVSNQLNLGDGHGTAGPLTFDGGTLQVTGTSFTEYTGGYDWSSGGGGLDIADAANTFTINDTLTGGGGLTKKGAGTLVLAAANSFGGLTTVEGGTLRIEDPNALAGTTFVVPTSGFDISAVADETVTFGAISGSGDLTGTGWRVAGGNGDSTTYSGSFTSTGGFTKTGAGTMTLSGDNSAWGGHLSVDAGTVVLANDDVVPDTGDVTVWGGLQLDSFQSIDGLGGTGTVDLSTNALSVGNGDGDSEFGGRFIGNRDVWKDGTGTFTISGDNSGLAGNVNVVRGTLRAGVGDSLGYDTRVEIYTDGTLQIVDGEEFGTLDGEGNVDLGANDIRVGFLNYDTELSGSLSGSGTLYKTGTGTMTFSGDNSSFTGTLGVEAGTVRVGRGDSLGGQTDVVVSAGAGMVLEDAENWGGLSGDGEVDTAGFPIGVCAGNQDSIFNGAITGAGQLLKQGTGTLTLTGQNTYTGGTDVQNGTLRITGADERLPDARPVNVQTGDTFQVVGITETIGGLTGAGAVTISGGGLLRVGGGDATSDLDGDLDGDGMLEKIDAGTLTLGGTNFLDGGTRLVGGVLSVASDLCLGGPGAGLTFDGGTLSISSNSFTNSNRPVAFTANGGTIETPAGVNYPVLFGSLTGSGDLAKTGTGTLALRGDNGAYTGDIRIMGGTLKAGVSNSLGDATRVTIEPGAHLEIEGNEGWGSLAGAGQVLLYGGYVSVGADGTSTEYSGEIVGGSSYHVYKTGTGTMTLSSASFYAGNTYVDAGTLVAANDWACGGGIVTIRGGTLQIAEGVILGNTVSFSAAGGGLAGNGTLASDLTLPADSFLAPGTSAGIFTVDGNHTQQVESTLAIELGGVTPGTEHDQLGVTGTANLDGTLELALIDAYVPRRGDVFEIITAGEVLGTFQAITLIDWPGYLDVDVTYSADSVVVEVVRRPPLTHGSGGLAEPTDVRQFPLP